MKHELLNPHGNPGLTIYTDDTLDEDNELEIHIKNSYAGASYLNREAATVLVNDLVSKFNLELKPRFC